MTTQPTSAVPAIRSPRVRGALLLVGLLLIAANLRASITSVGPVLDQVRDSLQLSAFTASILISIPLVAFALISPVSPWLARRIGLERVLGLALAVLAVAIVVRSLPWLPGLWIGTALLGVAIAVMNVALPSLVKRDYPARIGQITGVYSAAQSVAAATAAGVAVPISGIAQDGWRLSLGIWAGLALIALAVFAPQLRSPRRDSGPRAAAAPELRHRSPWGTALGWQVTLFMGLQSTVFYSLITWLPSIEQAAGTSAAAAGFHQFLLNGLGIVGSLGTAALIHRWRDQRPVVVVSATLTGLGLLGVLLLPGWSVVWVCMLGVGGGASIVLALSLFGLRTAHHDQAARLSGMAQGVGYLLAAAGPIGIGLAHDVTGSWAPAVGILVVVIAAQFVFGTLASRAKVIS